MNTDIIKGNWHEVKGKLLKYWGKLTNDDVTLLKGSSEELRGLLQEKYGYEKDRANKEIEDFAKAHEWK